jgi:hypothetical protein
MLTPHKVVGMATASRIARELRTPGPAQVPRISDAVSCAGRPSVWYTTQ